MSDKGSSSDKSEPAPDLSALDFGPAWARADQGKKGHTKKGSTNKGQGSTKGGSHAGAGAKRSKSAKDKQDSRQAGKHDRGRNSGKQHRHGGSDRDRRGGPHKGRGRNDYSKGGREQRHEVAPPEGVKARIMPIEEGLDAMAKQISATGRTHSVFDLAWLVLGSLDRFHVIFESDQQGLYRSETDHSVWHSQKECMTHFVSSDLINKYYEEEITEVEPPSGNFQSVARCGLSKKLIGPPNHHGYQQALVDLHRERFSSMPIERYKSKVIMEHGEEAVQEWLDAMCQQKRWHPKTEQAEPAPSKEATTEKDEGPEGEVPAIEQEAVEEVSVESEVEIPVNDEPVTGEPVAEGSQEAAPAEAEIDESNSEAELEAEIESKEAAEEEAKSEGLILASHREVEQHFLENGFEKEFYQGKSVSALANIPARMISSGLMTLLRSTVSEEKRYPGNLASILCRQMSGRHLAVYKWKKRLHCGPARPRHASRDLIMADRPAKMFQWVTDHPGANIDELWKDCLPADIDEATRHTWYHDLHWLINEGLLLLLSDGTIHAAKEQSGKQQESKQKVSEQKGVENKETEQKPANKEAPQKTTKKKTAKKVAKKAAKKASSKVAKKSAKKPEVEDEVADPEAGSGEDKK